MELINAPLPVQLLSVFWRRIFMPNEPCLVEIIPVQGSNLSEENNKQKFTGQNNDHQSPLGKCRCRHGFMKPDLRISSKDYSRAENLIYGHEFSANRVVGMARCAVQRRVQRRKDPPEAAVVMRSGRPLCAGGDIAARCPYRYDFNL